MIDPDSRFQIGDFELTGVHAMIAIIVFMLFLVLVGFTAGVIVAS